MTRQVWHRQGGMLVEGPSVGRYQGTKVGRRQAPYVVGDIQPYQVPGTDDWITSRSAHRSHLRANGLVEIGNEKAAFDALRPPDPVCEADVAEDIKAAIEDCRNGRGTKPVPLAPELAEAGLFKDE
jgi:hypothetical protein